MAISNVYADNGDLSVAKKLKGGIHEGHNERFR